MNKHTDSHSLKYTAIEASIAVFESLTNSLSALHAQALNRFNALNHSLGHMQAQTERLLREVSGLAVCLEAKEQCLLQPLRYASQRISRLVTDLQYHDIIRQKLEHVEQGNDKILQAIKTAASQQDCPFTEWLLALVSVAQLHIKLLTYTHSEYHRAFQNMHANLNAFRASTRSMQEVGDIVLSWVPEQGMENIKQAAMQVRQLSRQLASDISTLMDGIEQPSSFEQAVNQICGQIRGLVGQLPMDRIQTWQRLEVLRELAQLYTMQSERTIYQKVLKSKSNINLFEQTPTGEVELF